MRRAASPAFSADIGGFATSFTASKPKAADYKTVALPPPPDLEEMPNPTTAPAVPADQGVPMRVDIAAITVPKK